MAANARRRNICFIKSSQNSFFARIPCAAQWENMTQNDDLKIKIGNLKKKNYLTLCAQWVAWLRSRLRDCALLRLSDCALCLLALYMYLVAWLRYTIVISKILYYWDLKKNAFLPLCIVSRSEREKRNDFRNSTSTWRSSRRISFLKKRILASLVMSQNRRRRFARRGHCVQCNSSNCPKIV